MPDESWPAWAAFEEHPPGGDDVVGHWIKVYSALSSLLGSGGSVTIVREGGTAELTAPDVSERLAFWSGELAKREERVRRS